jgi:hypothetical protein
MSKAQIVRLAKIIPAQIIHISIIVPLVTVHYALAYRAVHGFAIDHNGIKFTSISI